ncbi:hypothetical protein CRYO30217_03071 [Parvicella tangerina]|uniref:Uncharacterized protein n=1 Tax=Parvicella tangerina TaxID=2829795 RepID=A0A916JQD4_9FLAO|nr:hypothetical protein CRYO30217_03071 [Parvicella tangerina]
MITFVTEPQAQEVLQYQTDIQGNSYTIFDQEIVKFNAASKEEFRYSNKLLGNISILDVTNPLRPLIFYEDVQKLVITDNTLSKQNQQVINFEDLSMFQIKCVATSRIDNGTWVYDQESLQIVKLNRTLERVVETGNLLQLLHLSEFHPTKMVEKSGYLYVYCPVNGFLIFDIYGTFYKTIPITEVAVWNIIDEQILYVKHRESFVYHLKDFVSEPLATTYPKSNKILWIDKQYLYHGEGNEVFKTPLIAPKK